MWCVLLPAILLVVIQCAATAQGSKPVPGPSNEIRRFTLDFGKPQDAGLSRNPAMVFAETACRADGTLFVGIADSPPTDSSPAYPSLHSLDREGKVVRFEPSHLAGYVDQSIWWAGHFFAGDHWVATLVSATPQSRATDRAAQNSAQLALIYDGKGAFQRSVRLPDGLQIFALGVYDSGKLLIVASGSDNKLARLLVVDSDGGIDRELRLFDEDYNSRPNAKEDQLLSGVQQNKSGALTSIEILPYGPDLLLLPGMTRQSVIEVNEHGIIRVYPLQIPKGFMLNSMLSMSGHTWKIATLTDHIEPSGSTGDGPPQSYALTNGPVFEFDPSSGAALRRIEAPETPKDAPGTPLVCEYEGEYTALTTDPKSGSLELLKASIPQ
jgi:hypothetical protein